MTQPKLLVVVENPADLADAALLFERTAQALKAMLQMAKVMWEQDENYPDSDAIEQALERMAKQLLVIYPQWQRSVYCRPKNLSDDQHPS